MSLPHLLLVDDSEAILAFERAALSGHYAISTASNGQEALEKIPQIKPACILLDLSMPQMDGDEVLARIKANNALKSIPVIIISSERVRAEGLILKGAAACLIKPIRADELLRLVGRVLEQARKAERQGSLAVLFLGIGKLEVGVPLDCVRTVLHQPLTQPLPGGPAYLREFFELHGEPVCILDLPTRLAMKHEVEVQDRQLVVVEAHGLMLGLCCDRIRDPEEFLPADVKSQDKLGGADHGLLAEMFIAVVRSGRGHVPIIDPKGLLSRGLLRSLPTLLREVSEISVAS